MCQGFQWVKKKFDFPDDMSDLILKLLECPQALTSYMARVLLVPLVNSAMKRQPTKLFPFLLTASDWGRTFHTAAFVVLCIVLTARTVLVSHQCFGYCCAVLAQHEGSISSSAPLLPPKVSKLGVGKTKLIKRIFRSI